MSTRKNTRRGSRALLLLGGAALVGGALVGLSLSLSGEEAPAAPARTAAPALGLPHRALTPIEQAATRRFPNVQAKVRMSDGHLADPVDEENALALKVNVYRHVLAQEEEKRDPTFRLRAEAELESQRPARASVQWEDESGTRVLVFDLKDRTGCGLGEMPDKFELGLDEVAEHPCLERGDLWDPGTVLTVELEPVAHEEALWADLLKETMREMASEAYLARASIPEEN